MQSKDQTILLEEAKKKYKKEQASPLNIQELTVETLDQFNPTSLNITTEEGLTIPPTYSVSEAIQQLETVPLYNRGPAEVDNGCVYLQESGGTVKVFYKMAKAEGFMAVSRKTGIPILDIFKINQEQGWKELLGDDIGYKNGETRKLQLGEGVCVGTLENSRLLQLLTMVYEHESNAIPVSDTDIKSRQLFNKFTTKHAKVGDTNTVTKPNKLVISEAELGISGNEIKVDNILSKVLRFLTVRDYEHKNENINTGSFSGSIEVSIGGYIFIFQIEAFGGIKLGATATDDRRIQSSFTGYFGGKGKLGVDKVAAIEAKLTYNNKLLREYDSMQQLAYHFSHLIFEIADYITAFTPYPTSFAPEFKDAHSEEFNKTYMTYHIQNLEFVGKANINNYDVEGGFTYVLDADVEKVINGKAKGKSEDFKNKEKSKGLFENSFLCHGKITTPIGEFGVQLTNKSINANLNNNGLVTTQRQFSNSEKLHSLQLNDR